MGTILLDFGHLPYPKQIQFIRSRKRYTGYGGARSGGKSWAVRVNACLLALYYPGIRILIMRRTFPELVQNHVLPLRKMLTGVAQWKEKGKCFEFINSSLILVGYCRTRGDLERYQGVEYDCIFLDEATHFEYEVWTTMDASCRGMNQFPHQMFLTCNPGGIGHEWVKRLFIDRNFRPEENPDEYEFIQANVMDNPDFLAKNPNYLKSLEGLPPVKRDAWLYGKWDIGDLLFFGEFSRDLHVVEPFQIPAHWKRYRCMDYGLDMLACYWIAMDEAGNAYFYKELYEGRDNGKGPDGRGLIVSEAAKRILEVNGGERIEKHFAPPDMWNRQKDTGNSLAKLFDTNGVKLVRVDNSRMSGWMEVREWLAPVLQPDGTTRPRLRIFRNCVNLIRCLGSIQMAEDNPDDVSDTPHELTHSVDALRYFCAGRPCKTRVVTKEVQIDPFGVQKKKTGAFGSGEKIQPI